MHNNYVFVGAADRLVVPFPSMCGYGAPVICTTIFLCFMNAFASPRNCNKSPLEGEHQQLVWQSSCVLYFPPYVNSHTWSW